MLGSILNRKKAGPGSVGFGQSGTAAMKLAIQSIQNIANIDIGSTPAADSGQDAADLAAISDVLRGAGKPLAVAKVAELLQWDSATAAKAFARGGQSGNLKFSKDGETTLVSVAPD